MANPRIPTGRQAKPGQLLRQQALDLARLAEDHTITEVIPVWEITDDGVITNEYYIVTTTRGTWTFGPDEPITFPRRPYNQRRDWRKAPAPPSPLDLAVGDLLPWRWGDTPATETEQAEGVQRVIAVTRNRARPNVVQVTTHSALDDLLTTEFLPTEPIRYPRPARDRPSGYNKHAPTLTGYGPYLYVDHTTEDEYLLFLITHPAGRGRWPAYTNQMIPLGHGTYLDKPPGQGEPWPTFVGEDPNHRHPKDPQWGVDLPIPPIPIEPERITAAEAAYADYRARAESAGRTENNE